MSRVLLVSAHFPPKVGGVERYAHRVAIGLRNRHGHEVSVLTTTPGRHRRADVVDGLRVVSVPIRWTVSATPFNLAWFRQVRRIIAEERPDVINTHAPVPGLADVCLSVRSGVPAIASYHSGSMKKSARVVDAAIGGYETAVLPALLRRAEAVVTTFPRANVAGVPSRYIPPGVDTDIFHPDANEGHHRDVVLYVGRIERASAWKGIATLLEAFAELAPRFPSLRLRLAGGGDAVARYQSMAVNLGVGRRVTFLGPLAPAELAREYRTATVAVLPSLTEAEAFGMVLIEAMACGTAVVASRVGGMPAIVNDTGGGLLAEPGDSRSLAASIGVLLEDPRRRETLAAAGLSRVRSRYRWDSVIDAYDELVQQVTAPVRTGGKG